MRNTIAVFRTLLLVAMVWSAASGTYTTAVVDHRPAAGVGEMWVDAEACLMWPELLSAPECFSSEEEMDRRIDELDASPRAARLACSGT